ncbi:metallophosphoesterase family protein [Flavobacterium agricola]|uniref:phosphoesterase n=1 Tax=Flavobacterium agricola TaxID=2870839 RepID=UPI0022214A4E|nr:phosphoesterase [Flavobacterium agricola]
MAIVKNMVDAGHAIALMGNHEYNAICFNTLHPDGGYLRAHDIKNISQHYQTLNQFKNNQALYDEYIAWFKTLPLFYENEAFCAVHASWDFDSIAFLKQHVVHASLSEEQLIASAQFESPYYLAIEKILKGSEIKLPEGYAFQDKDGNARQVIRTKWWLNPKGLTYKEFSVIPMTNLPEVAVAYEDEVYYNEKHKPVFFGHYWLQGTPSLIRENICCLDYSVAKKGHLVAYTYQSEQQLTPKNLTFV